MKRRRVKITGIGPVTPAGIGREAFWKGILEPVSRVRPFTKLNPELGAFVAAHIDRFSIGEYVDRSLVPKGAARHTLFGVAGASLALRDAGLTTEELNAKNTVVVVGSCVMDFEGIGRTVIGVTTKGVRGAIGRGVYTSNIACISSTIAQVLEVDARTTTVQSSCCTGLDAIGHAARLVAFGEADIAICGGTDAPLFQCPLVELRSIEMTPSTVENYKRINRPFDMWRTTGVVSEGAGIFVVEPEDSPRPGYAYVSGYSFANDPEGALCGGMAKAMKLAVADAGLSVGSIESINAWGPGHKLIDAAEAKATVDVFGDRLSEVPAFSIKGAIGNALGAAPAIQVAVAALGLKHELLPPTVNWEYADPACPLNLSRTARSVSHENTLVNAHGLAGVNASLVMERC